jgi:23S rRNA (guanine745-N1)-methyltransferase
MTLSKKIMNAQVLENNAQLFSCPICSSPMKMLDSTRLVCAENHSFDLSKNGYVNLAPQAHVTKYDKSLFEARKRVIDSGFFNQLLHYIIQIVSQRNNSLENVAVLDAGCGEGSHLSAILSGLTGSGITGVGIDLAKEGVAAAAKEHPGHIWCVADLANCPFQDQKFDTIINILSPANYAEFTRLLKPDGLFVKVVPESGYLKELREIFYDDNKEQSDSDPLNRIEEHFKAVTTERITYQFSLPNGLLAPLIRMTPLSWGASKEKIEEALSMEIPSITIDYTVISGLKN